MKLTKIGRRIPSPAKNLVKATLGRKFPELFGVRRYRRIVDQYEVDNVVTRDGTIPVFWWTDAPNFGDLLSPWLIERMTSMPTEFSDRDSAHYVTIGSIVGRASNESILWGTGSFGTETKKRLSPQAKYHAVRGPLTRQILKNAGINCAPVYGDPALLAPLYYHPRVPVTYEIGVVVRWSEKEWMNVHIDPKVKIINLKTSSVDETIRAFLACKRIISSSLHGLIIADAYGIPNAWRQSETGKGGVFKYYDYFASVNKFRIPHQYSIGKEGLEPSHLLKKFDFDGKPIEFNYRKLLDACPFLRRKPQSATAMN